MIKSKNKNRIIGLIMATFMGASFLVGSAGCNKPDNENPDDTDNTVNEKVEIDNLEVNGAVEPLGIDDTQPVFSWSLASEARDKSQSAYKVVVKDGDTTVWNSGKVKSKNNYGVIYDGDAELKSKTRYDWTVTVWDEDNTQCATASSHFETGVMSENDWNSDWIGEPSLQTAMNFNGANWIWDRAGHPENQIPDERCYFRRTLNVSKTISRVQIAMSADDNATLYLNGKQVISTPDVKDAWETATVTTVSPSQFTEGENVIAVEATNTANGYAGFLAKIEIYYEGSSKDTIVTDSNWKISTDNKSGWASPEFDDNGWKTPSGSDVISYGENPWGDRVSFTSSDKTAPVFRKVFTTQDKTISYARAYIAGLGLYDLKINGKHIDESVLNPANTDFDKTVLYDVYDVTKLLNAKGENAVAVELGNGFYNLSDFGGWSWNRAPWTATPRMRMELDVHYSDGTVQKVCTDPTWKYTKNGPTTANSIYVGETFDARRHEEFSSVSYDDSDWNNAGSVSAPKGKLVWQDMEKMFRTAAFSDSSDTVYGVKVEAGIESCTYNSAIRKYTVKLPRNITGWSKINFRNTTAGTKIIIDYGETLASDGNVNLHEEAGIFQRDIYICKGANVETYEPKFNYKGFQYVQVFVDGSGSLELTANDVTAYLIHNDVATTALFETSSELFNTLHSLMVNTLLNNYQGKPTDTPWLEKNGWLGDVNMAIGTMGFDFDIARFMAKFLGDIKDSQDDNGSIPQVAPIGDFGRTNAPVWNSVFIFAVEELCNTYGMGWLVEKYYDSMKKLAVCDINTLKTRNWIWGEDSVLGDWVTPLGNENGSYDENPPEGGSLCATAYVYKMLGTMAEYAQSLDEADDVELFNEARENILNAFNKKFLSNGVYDTGWWAGNHAYNRTKYRQTSNILPLAFGMVPEENLDDVLENLVQDIIAKDYHLDTGVVGTKYILPVLCDYGYSDIAYRIIAQTTYPSWGYWLGLGATTLWEMWESTSRSHDHYFLGTYDEWFFTYLGGIKDVKEGYKTFTLNPLLAGDLTDVNISLNTVRGTLGVKWKLVEGNKAQFDIEIPFGSTAKLYLPTKNKEEITLDGETLSKDASGIKSVSLNKESGKVLVTLGSGKYKFVSPLDARSTYKGSLENAVKYAETLSQADYQSAGWANFKTQLDSAKGVLESKSSTQSAINAATDTLFSAIADLQSYVNANRVALKTKIAEIKASGYADLSYSEGALSAFGSSLSAADKAVSNTGLSETEMAQELAKFEMAVKTLLSSCKSNLARISTANVTASSSVTADNDGWGLSRLTDGNTGYSGGWSSSNLLSQQHEEWVQIDFGFAYMFDKISIYTSAQSQDAVSYGMPLDFVIEVSDDGINYTTVVSEKNYQPRLCGEHVFKFEPVTAKYVRIRGTKLNGLPHDGNTYRMQLAEIEVYNTPRADMSNFNELIARYENLNRSLYTTTSLVELEDVMGKVFEFIDKTHYESDQAQVDEMAAELENALDGLVLKNA